LVGHQGRVVPVVQIILAGEEALAITATEIMAQPTQVQAGAAATQAMALITAVQVLLF
jgi:hypothetical protein